MNLWQDSNTANQKFTFKSFGEGKWKIVCAKEGLTVELPLEGSRVSCG